MPNYLQRIAESGAGTTSLLKPAAVTRALMPPIGPLVRPAMSDAAAQTGDELPEPQMHAMRGPHGAAKTNENQPAIPAYAIPSQSASVREEAQQKVMDRSRITPPAVLIPPIAPDLTASRAHVRAPEGLRRVQSNTERQHATERIADTTPRIEAPREARIRNESRRAEEVSTEASRVSPAPSTPIPLEGSGKVQRKPAAMNPASSPPGTPVPSLPVSPIQNAKPKSALPPSANAASADGMSLAETHEGGLNPHGAHEAAQLQSPLTPRAPIETRIVETQRSEIRATTPQQAAQSLLSGVSDKRRRTQISIGRIDVQVNNQVPPQPASPQPARTAARPNFLEERYLGRFFVTL